MTCENNSVSLCKKNLSGDLVLGGSRGLGRSISHLVSGQICSRSEGHLLDLSKESSLEELWLLILKLKPLRVFYCAGGGPHGGYFEKKMQSHKWAFAVNHFSPMWLVRALIAADYEGEFVYIGSAIAERSESLNSLSYSASKVLSKNCILSLDKKNYKVFSPPYMNTKLLPDKAWPRLECPDQVVEPDKVARVLLEWLSDIEKTQSRHHDSRHFDWMERFEYNLPEDKEL